MSRIRSHGRPGFGERVLLWFGVGVFLVLDAIAEPRHLWDYVRDRMGIRR